MKMIRSISDEYFNQRGVETICLTPQAAINVCREAESHALVVVRVEGGIWRFPGFEARLDCIWDGLYEIVVVDDVAKNNKCAEEFIISEMVTHDVFIVTASPIYKYARISE